MSPRGRIGVPSLDSEQLTSLLVAVADIIITLDENYVVVGVTDPMNLDNLTLWKWNGRKIVDVVAPDSVSKMSRLLRAEAADGTPPDRWRHVNFLDAAGGNIPLLVKYFHLPAGQMTARLLVGRDLRPLEAAQQRFQRALADAAPSPARRRRSPATTRRAISTTSSGANPSTGSSPRPRKFSSGHSSPKRSAVRMATAQQRRVSSALMRRISFAAFAATERNSSGRPDQRHVADIARDQQPALAPPDTKARPREEEHQRADAHHHEVVEAHDLRRHARRRDQGCHASDAQNIVDVRADDIAERHIRLSARRRRQRS